MYLHVCSIIANKFVGPIWGIQKHFQYPFFCKIEFIDHYIYLEICLPNFWTEIQTQPISKKKKTMLNHWISFSTYLHDPSFRKHYWCLQLTWHMNELLDIHLNFWNQPVLTFSKNSLEPFIFLQVVVHATHINIPYNSACIIVKGVSLMRKLSWKLIGKRTKNMFYFLCINFMFVYPFIFFSFKKLSG